jgi:glutathione S-transferase
MDVHGRQHFASALGQSESFIAAGLSLVAASGGTRLWAVGNEATAGRKQAWEASCRPFIQHLRQSGGPYIAGRDVSLADLAIWPFMERFLVCARVFSKYDATLGSTELRLWVKSMQSRKSVQWAAADQSAFVRVLHDQASLDWFDYVHCGARDLHPQLVQA